MAILFKVNNTPPGPVWDQYFDNTEWTPSTASWNGSSWDSVSSQLILAPPLGTWYLGYRPTKVRLTINKPSISFFRLYAGGGVMLLHSAPYSNLAEISISGWTTTDIYQLYTFSSEDYQITNIEFLP